MSLRLCASAGLASAKVNFITCGAGEGLAVAADVGDGAEVVGAGVVAAGAGLTLGAGVVVDGCPKQPKAPATSTSASDEATIRFVLRILSFFANLSIRECSDSCHLQ